MEDRMQPKDALKSTLVTTVEEIGAVLADAHLTHNQKAARIETIFGRLESLDIARRRRLEHGKISRANGRLAELGERQGTLNLCGVA